MNGQELKAPNNDKIPYHTSIGIRNANKPPVHILTIALLSIFTYIGSYIVDIILLDLYFQRSEWIWFGITLLFISIPSIIVQLFSCKWFHDDGDLKVSTVIMHILFLGPVERYWNVFVYGLNTPRLPEQTSFQKKYLTNWRDVSMLRFLYPIIETGPQVSLQLYILLYYFMREDDRAMKDLSAAIIVKIFVSVASFSVGMIAYNDDLKSSHGKGLSGSGYACQIIYRLLMLSSRIIAIVLFTMQFQLIILGVLVIHWMLMIYWVKKDKPNFFAKQDGKFHRFFQAFFKVITGFVYVFCYISTNSADGRCNVISQVIYYALLFMENVSMTIAWIMLNARGFDYFVISASCAVFGTMILGVVFMVIYYKVFHPNIKKSNVADST